MNNQKSLMSPFKQNIVIGIAFFCCMLLAGLYQISFQSFQDTTYIRQAIQLNEEPVDPFDIVTVHYYTTTYNEATIGRKDSVRFICEPEDTYRIQALINDGEHCGMGYCITDSILSTEVERVE